MEDTLASLAELKRQMDERADAVWEAGQAKVDGMATALLAGAFLFLTGGGRPPRVCPRQN